MNFVGPRCRTATAPPTAGSSIRSRRPASIAARPARPARPGRENVRFHATCADAERAGFRPCKRCKPDQPSLVEEHAAKVAEACRLIEAADELPNLSELAAVRRA